MILHIVKKDLRRLWPLVAGLVVADFAYAVLRAASGPFPEDHVQLMVATVPLALLVFLLPLFLCVMVVQLDPLPDDRQDWLVRPVWRRDLLFAKLLFVIVFLQIPMLAAGMLQGVASGFPLDQTLLVALRINFYYFIAFILPALAFGALTRTIGQSLGLLLAVLLAGVAIIGSAAWMIETWSQPTLFTGDNLTGFIIGTGLLLVGTTAILGAQFFRRTTLAGRIALIVTIVLTVAVQVLFPESPAFALENWVAGTPDQSLALSFAPEAGKYRATGNSDRVIPHPDGDTMILVPLRLTGIPQGQTVTAENIRGSLIGPDGKPQYIGTSEALLRFSGPSGAQAYAALLMSKDMMRVFAARTVRVELDMVLDIAPQAHTYQLSASGDDRLLPGLGRCVTRINSLGTGVEIGCVEEGSRSVQASFAFADHLQDDSDTSGWNMHEAPLNLDMTDNNRVGLIFRDPDAVPHPGVVVTLTRPTARIVRHITIPAIRLNDWKVDALKTAP